ncbi:MAG: hemin uptake protein HemP [Planctomycetaceae bacterium]|nr:hemin uptake protein HemP [Planctomycetaceae bacterium]
MSDTPLPSDSLTEQTESQPAEQSAVPDEAGSLSADDTPEEPLRTVTSAELLCGQRELLIEHEGEVYRLRVTRNSRLILQK